ncbi:uncharacterized protein LOC131955272 [Physella acuta]|uniref:uncharacterized protein LOC131955272 n=1 Tax=Physella acuta TaxID=109671 RepID=UPI0027DE9699|nr:uncharacterized protein LOC131955272 [Physella acuta]
MEAGGKLVTWCRQMIADPNFPNFEQFEDGVVPYTLDGPEESRVEEDDEYSRTLHEYTLYFQPNEVAGKDYKTWKARLRNALRKSNYIERLKDLDELTGPTPHMVCKFKRQSASYDHSSSIDELGDSNSGQDYEMVSEDSQSWERSQEFQEGMDVAPSWPQTSDHLINGHGDVAPSWPQTSDHPINGHGVVAPSWPQTSDHPINGHGGVAPSWPQTSDHVINGHGGVAPSWPQTSDHPINGHGEVDQTWPQNFENMNGLVAHDELLPHTYTPLDKPADLETLLTSQSIEQRIQTLFDKRMHQTEATPEPLLIIDVLYDSPNKNVKTFTLKADVPQCHLFAQTVHDQTLQRKIQGDRQEIQFELPDLKSVPDISKKIQK